MQIDRYGVLKVEKIRQHSVGQLRGENLHEADRADVTAHAEGAPIPEIKAGGSDGVLCAGAGLGDVLPIKAELS